MTSALRKVFEDASKLPEDEQDALAAAFAEQMRSDRRWQELFDNPRSGALLKRLADQALEEHRRGETQPLEPDRL